jgi:hypothetical protein
MFNFFRKTKEANFQARAQGQEFGSFVKKLQRYFACKEEIDELTSWREALFLLVESDLDFKEIDAQIGKVELRLRYKSRELSSLEQRMREKNYSRIDLLRIRLHAIRYCDEYFIEQKKDIIDWLDDKLAQ